MKHVTIGHRQADYDLQADNSYDFYTVNIILCLDQISSLYLVKLISVADAI
jgi:hypothetical protein